MLSFPFGFFKLIYSKVFSQKTVQHLVIPLLITIDYCSPLVKRAGESD